MNIRSLFAWMLMSFILFSCNYEMSDIEGTASTIGNTKELLIEFVDVNNCHIVKDKYSDFRIVDEEGNIIKTILVEDTGKFYLGFKPSILANKETLRNSFRVYKGHNIVATIESSFRLDSVRLVGSRKTLYYTNTENKIFNRPTLFPTRVLVCQDGSYKEEGQAKFCVVFNFPSAKIQATEAVNYDVAISGFMGKSLVPNQKGLIVAAGSAGRQCVTLAIESTICNYYEQDGTLQDSYNIIYEITSKQLFNNSEKHILKITRTGDCYDNKIQACSLDGRQLNLDSARAYDSFGREYLNITII